MYFNNEVQKSFIFYKKDDHQKCPQTVGNIYLRKGAEIMLCKKKDGFSEVTRY